MREYAVIKEKERQMKILDEKLKEAASKEQAMLAIRQIQKYQLRVSYGIVCSFEKRA